MPENIRAIKHSSKYLGWKSKKTYYLKAAVTKKWEERKFTVTGVQ